jgi:hypothetical protein
MHSLPFHTWEGSQSIMLNGSGEAINSLTKGNFYA